MTFEQAHPDIVAHIEYDKLKTYKHIDERNNIVEAWDRDENGVWKNTTFLHQELQRLEREEAKLAKEAKKLEEVQE